MPHLVENMQVVGGKDEKNKDISKAMLSEGPRENLFLKVLGKFSSYIALGNL